MGGVKKILSQGCLRGVDILKILVTIGSMKEKKFTRLFNIIDELCEENIIDKNNVIAQVGFDGYKSKNFKTFDMISDKSFKKIINECDLIITHAGTGTVISCLKQNKKVIVFPRMSKFNEHYDDHQLELCNIFTKLNYVLCAKDKNELKDILMNIDTFSLNRFKSSNEKINGIIRDFIEN